MFSPSPYWACRTSPEQRRCRDLWIVAVSSNEPVRQVVYPAVAGGEQTLRDR